jgi:general stress protein 26
MQEEFEKLAEMIKDINFTMMTTIDGSGKLHSRPMATMTFDKSSDFQGTLWFFTKMDSFKVHNIEEDKEVNLAYANPDSQRYVSVSGRASIEKDKTKMKELWSPTLLAWFPEGLNDPEIALIKVEVESAEIWDTPPTKVVQIMGVAKSIMTGKPYEQKAQSQHIDLRSH